VWNRYHMNEASCCVAFRYLYCLSWLQGSDCLKACHRYFLLSIEYANLWWNLFFKRKQISPDNSLGEGNVWYLTYEVWHIRLTNLLCVRKFHSDVKSLMECPFGGHNLTRSFLSCCSYACKNMWLVDGVYDVGGLRV
jgi:hypothetical protein